MAPFHKKRISINGMLLAKIIGYLLIIESLFMFGPLLAAFIFDEKTIPAYLISICTTGGCGLLMTLLKPQYKDMGKKEAFFLTGITWIILSIFGMLPFLLCKTHLTFTDAFFEAISGFTTTGASTLTSLENTPKSILLWRCILQWIGGLGIIAFTLAVVPMLNYAGGMQLFNAEVTGITHDKLRPRISNTAKSLWSIYIFLTIVLIILLLFSDMGIFDSICYSFATISTGGYATSDMSLQTWNSTYIQIVICIFMFIGGVDFTMFYAIIEGKKKSFFKYEPFKYYILVVFSCYAILSLNLLMKGMVKDISDITIDPLFQTVSIVSSTGLVEPEFHNWGPLAVFILIILMAVGGCAGSTAGGAKIDRGIVLVKFLKNEIHKMLHPGSVTAVAINKRGIPLNVVQKTLAFLFFYGMIIAASGIILSTLDIPMKESFYYSLASISNNTGPSSPISGISGDYSVLPDLAKWTLAFVMLIGRLEIFTVLLLFTPTFWRK